ncbi:MAG: hypothetical protein KDE58_42790 [Caldilineaceae bacterium]|nr:hypothetical protein [Caldilineaceae bacterium]
MELIEQNHREWGFRLRPSFNVNEKRIEGAVPYERLVQLFAELGVTAAE